MFLCFTSQAFRRPFSASSHFAATPSRHSVVLNNPRWHRHSQIWMPIITGITVLMNPHRRHHHRNFTVGGCSNATPIVGAAPDPYSRAPVPIRSRSILRIHSRY
ncbi:hypothetical protein Nepgr_001739 [Nepenthes gracilis]|uniref:Uncharacterized protein n=1 Tax=Nepenthes gracilis TaxID=150966 RepID=A0AAD3RXZ0_NEPGR|nr:hypothetical protein Nepgr_001739 [Nepenthes gracilis]